MPAATRDQFFAAAKSQIRREPIELPSAGITVYVRGMKAGERLDIMHQWVSEEDASRSGLMAKVAWTCTTTESGDALFTPEDRDELLAIPFEDLNAIVEKAWELSGLKLDPDEEGKP